MKLVKQEIFSQKHGRTGYTDTILNDFLATDWAFAKIDNLEGREISSVESALRQAIYRRDIQHKIGISVRKGQVYLIRKEGGHE